MPEINSKLYSFIDLGGSPSKDTRTAAERNRDYWHPFKGFIERFKSSMSNDTNPLKGIEKTILPATAGATLVTSPATMILGTIGGETTNKLTGGWGKWLENKTSIPYEIGDYLNPGAIYWGGKGYNISKNNLASKFIKGDSDLSWAPLNRNHWIFNKKLRTPNNVSMAITNRLLPFLNNVEKTPFRIAAYNIGKRTKGNASISLKDAKSNEPTYTGSATPEGNNGDRNLLGFYLFLNDPLIKHSPWFLKISKSFKPTKSLGFNYNNRYSKLYPGIENRRYLMESVVKDTHPLNFDSLEEFNLYSNGIGKIQGKEGDMVIDMGQGYATFRLPGTNYVGPIDDVGGHLIKIDYDNQGKLALISQDMWKFNPADYAKRWTNDLKVKLAALMDKIGTPFILLQANPIRINKRRIWKSEDKIPAIARRNPTIYNEGLIMQKEGGVLGGKFKFKESALVKNAKRFNKRDMRKKFIKSNRPTYINNRIRKGLEGIKMVKYETPLLYNPIPENFNIDWDSFDFPQYDFSMYQNPINGDTQSELIYSEDIAELPKEIKQLEPILKSSKGLTEFNKHYDNVEKVMPEAKLYRALLTKLAEKESGFNSYILNLAGAPAYGYFQFMQDGKRYNNISKFAGTDIEAFRNNPELQILAAVKLAKAFKNTFSKKDLLLAKDKGYSMNALLAGAWLAGVGGVRKFLNNQGNPSDRHWGKSGTDVLTRMNLFNI